MNYQNLDQQRAANAIRHSEKYDFSGKEGGSIVKKIPTMIRENGFLGALAFALEKDKKGEYKNDGHNKVFDCIRDHLKQTRRIPDRCANPEEMLEFLVSESQDAAKLRDVTAESLLYLNYLRRFVIPKGDEE